MIGSLAAVSHIGCGDGGGGGGGVSAASCSSCQEAYTEEDCKRWGDLAGCEESVVDTTDTCKDGIAGCTFTNCSKGSPLCDDTGEASCASCDGDLTQDDCDAMADEAGCEEATQGDFTACGNPAKGCKFLGCDFRPACE